MKKQLISFPLIFSFVFSISAQTKEARKTDEFGSYSCDDLLARLDYFTNDIMKEPNAKGFIIVYEGKYLNYVNNGKGESEPKSFLPRFGESAYQAQSMQNYLIKFRNFPKEKFLFISGGFRENHTVELWIVPSGANPPKPTPTLENIKYRTGKPAGDICAGLG